MGQNQQAFRKSDFEKIQKEAARYRGIFESVPVSIWVEDWTEVIRKVNSLKEQRVTDFQKYFRENPGFVADALRSVRILDVNTETLSLFRAESKEQILKSLEIVFSTPDTLTGFIGELIALAEGKTVYRTEMALRTLRNELIQVLLTMTFPGENSTPGIVFVSIMDVTHTRQTEETLRRMSISRNLVGQILHDLWFAGGLSETILFRAGGQLATRISASSLAEFLETFASVGLGTLTIHEAQQTLRWTFTGDGLLETKAWSGASTCHYTRGFLHGVMSRLHGDTNVSIEETHCQSKGDKCCTFEVHTNRL